MEEYVAHKATHDIIYKNNNFGDEMKKYIISDTLFPLIEVLSHKFIYLNSLSYEKIEECDRDIKYIINSINSTIIYFNYFILFNYFFYY